MHSQSLNIVVFLTSAPQKLSCWEPKMQLKIIRAKIANNNLWWDQNYKQLWNSLKLLWCRKWTLLKAWSDLKQVHPQAQLIKDLQRPYRNLIRNCIGKFQWSDNSSDLKICPIYDQNAGMTIRSLNHHLKSHKTISSETIDNGIKTMEFQNKASTSLSIRCSGSVL